MKNIPNKMDTIEMKKFMYKKYVNKNSQKSKNYIQKRKNETK